MTRKRVTAALVASLMVGSVGLSASTAHDGDDEQRFPASQYRHDVMELVKYSGLSILFGLQGKVPTPDSHYEHHAEILNRAATMAQDAFEADTRGEEGKTGAKDKIWEDWDGFSAKMTKFVGDTAALKTAAASGDKAAIGEATKAVFGNCKSCHDDYRTE